MTTLSWKRKLPSKIQEKTANLFQSDANEQDDEASSDHITAPTKKKCIMGKLEESMRYMEEGVRLAECGKYEDAIKKFDIALLVKSSHEAKLHEMKAQAHLELNELYPAIESSDKAIQAAPLWAEAHQTLARTQMNYGDIRLALRNFSVALHLKPDFEEVRDTDLPWALELRTKEKGLKKTNEANTCDMCHHSLDASGKRTVNVQQVESLR